MRPALIALPLLAVTASIAIAQMPTESPGKADPARVTAGTYAVDARHTQVLWRVSHFGFNDYFGLFGDATGTLTIDPAKLAAAQVTIELPIASLATNAAGLTAHMQRADILDVAKFPTATFKSTSVTVAGTKAKIAGNLTLHGVTKPVVLDASFIGAGMGGSPGAPKKATVGFHATTVIKRSDFGVMFAVPFISDDVPLTISVAFEKTA